MRPKHSLMIDIADEDGPASFIYPCVNPVAHVRRSIDSSVLIVRQSMLYLTVFLDDIGAAFKCHNLPGNFRRVGRNQFGLPIRMTAQRSSHDPLSHRFLLLGCFERAASESREPDHDPHGQ